MNYYDILLAKKLEDDRDPQVVGLSVTENGTYAEEGKVYKPVVVNVPLGSKSITANGVYNAASDNLKGYSSVDVHVSGYKITDVSGLPSPIATFTDGSALPMPKLEVAIEPVQDLHGYDAPWVGGSGRNLFSFGSRVDGTIADVRYTSDDEYIYLNGTKQGVSYADLSSASNITLDSGTYYIRAFVISGTASNTVELYPYDGTNNLTANIINNERTLTLSESKTFRFRFAIWSDGTVLTNYKVGIVVSKTSSIDKFYPYSNICPISGWDECNVTVADDDTDPTISNVYTIDLDGTRYGGTLDVVSGVLTVKNAEVDLGDLTWTKRANGVFTLSGNSLLPDSPNNNFGKICSNYPVNNVFWENMGDFELSTSGGFNSRDITIKDSNYADADATTFKNAMSGVQLVYELATPLTIQLTPTAIKSLNGQNNLSADCGDVVEASYWEEL